MDSSLIKRKFVYLDTEQELVQFGGDLGEDEMDGISNMVAFPETYYNRTIEDDKTITMCHLYVIHPMKFKRFGFTMARSAYVKQKRLEQEVATNHELYQPGGVIYNKLMSKYNQ